MALSGKDIAEIVPGVLTLIGGIVACVKVYFVVSGRNKRQQNTLESKNNVVLFDQLHGLYKQACIDLENLRKEFDKKKEEFDEEKEELTEQMHKQDLDARDAVHEKNNLEQQKLSLQELWEREKRKNTRMHEQLGKKEEQLSKKERQLEEKEAEITTLITKIAEKEALIVELKNKIEANKPNRRPPG